MNSKIYFPVSENNEQFIALTNSKDGIIMPIVSEDENRFHVTAYVKKTNGKHFFDVHVKDQDTGEYHSVLRATIEENHLKEFAKKFEKIALESYKITQNQFILKSDVDTGSLYCIDCAYSNKALPVKFKEAKKFWKSLEEIKEKDILIIKNCKKPEHRTFYEEKKKILLHKTDHGKYFVHRESDELYDKLNKMFERHFSEEIKIFDKLIKDIKIIIEKERNFK